MHLNLLSLDVTERIRVALRGGISFSDLKRYRGAIRPF